MELDRTEARACAPRQPTPWELGADRAVHAVAIAAGLTGAALLLSVASGRESGLYLIAAAVYSVALLTMFSCSAVYNFRCWTERRSFFRKLDQAAIFVMIAGTYTPFTVLHLQGPWSALLTSFVWVLALAGILIRLLHGRLFDRVAIGLYLGFGWMGLVTLAPLFSALDTPVLMLLAAGGLLYSAGVIFHRWERLPFQNAIWHAFVVAAAAAHYLAVVAVLRSAAPA